MINQSWRSEAACAGKDPEVFFSSTATGKEKAQAICALCPVVTACLAAAMDEETPRIDPENGRMEGAFRNREMHAGVRGGLTHTQRWALRFPEEAEKYRADERRRAAAAVIKRAQAPTLPRPPRTEAQKTARRERDGRLRIAA